MRVILLVTVEGAVVRIQTLGISCEDMLTSEVFLTCNEYLADKMSVFLTYKAVIQDGGFASG